MPKYLIANLDEGVYRLRVELPNEVAQFTFMHFEGMYKILTYAFLPIGSAKSNLFKTIGGWKEISAEKALPIVESGMQKYQEMMLELKPSRVL